MDFDLCNPTAGVSEYDSERLKHHELYVRSSLLGGRLDLNGSVFYYTFEDARAAGAANNGSGLFGNIPEAPRYGLELESRLAVGSGWSLTAGLGLLDPEIEDAGPIMPQFEGEDLPQVPEVTANVGAAYVSPSGLDVSMGGRNVDAYRDFLGGQQVESYTVVDLVAGYAPRVSSDFDLRVVAYVENLFDKIYAVETRAGSVGAVGRPRTAGVAATLRF